MTNVETLLNRAREGFQLINVSDGLKQTAITNLERWLVEEQFSGCHPQLESSLESSNTNALFDAFFQQIPFGTGGRRGPVGFGTNRINEFTISTSIQGHCDFLKKYNPGRDDLCVVLAYDVRCFQDLRGTYDTSRANPLLGTTSRDFARVAARVYAANGIRVWFPNPDSSSYVSTPELSYAIRHLKTVGGLNVSASHNHPDDNGAKIYNSWGAQEVPPLDEEMAQIVESITEAETMPWDEAVSRELIRWTPAEVHDAYIETNVAASLRPDARSAKIVFTPLHGTGWSSVGAVLQKAGFDVECYPGQAEPDGTFPNVPFRSPNPEVPESLHGATEHAKETNADLVLAADPDADRIGMVVPDPKHGWTFLNGNQIGTLLTQYMLSEGKTLESRPDAFAVTTVVTTSLFGRIAESYGVKTVTDLGIGFKYIADVINQVEDKGEWCDVHATMNDFLIGIEESHGYLVTPELRDKDAAGAGLLLAEIVSSLRDEGRPVLDFIDEIYVKYGYVRNHLTSTVMQGARGFINIRQIQDGLRNNPPEKIGDLKVVKFTDRWDESGVLGKIVSSTDRAARDLLTFELEGGARIILRPSGTESKNKVYVEVCAAPLGEGAGTDALARQKEETDAIAHRISQDFVLEMLSRIGVAIPRFGLEASSLVPLEWKQDFANSLLPEIVRRLTGGEKASALEEWIDSRLSSYGADGRLLVKGAVAAYCDYESPAVEVREQLAEIFGL